MILEFSLPSPDKLFPFWLLTVPFGNGLHLVDPPLLRGHENTLVGRGIPPGGEGGVTLFIAALVRETARFHLRVQTACPHGYQSFLIDRLLLRIFLLRVGLFFLYSLLFRRRPFCSLLFL